MSMLARGGVLVVVLALCAWFGLGYYQARETGQASALVSSSASLSAAQAARARTWLDDAATLNPDLTVDLVRGQLALGEHRPQRAMALVRSVTRTEPLNLAAWIQLVFTAARAGDEREARVAAVHVSQLLHAVREPPRRG